MGSTIDATVTGAARAPLEQAWEVFVPIDLTTLFKGKGPLPAVVEVSNQTGTWDVVGQTRNVSLSDGGRLTEEITEVVLPGPGDVVFGYVVRGYSGFIGLLTQEARGRWVFREREDVTEIAWTYSFTSRNGAVRWLLALIISLFWKGYMADAMALTVQQIEEGSPSA